MHSNNIVLDVLCKQDIEGSAASVTVTCVSDLFPSSSLPSSSSLIITEAKVPDVHNWVANVL